MKCYHVREIVDLFVIFIELVVRKNIIRASLLVNDVCINPANYNNNNKLILQIDR